MEAEESTGHVPLSTHSKKNTGILMLDPLPSKIPLSAQNSEIKLDDVASEVNSQRWEKNNSVTLQDSDHENHHSRDQIQPDATTPQSLTRPPEER